jgi:membrane-associated protease RseP (regulator of RpoE activity)
MRIVQDKPEPPAPPRKPGRALTIIRGADGEEKVVESGDIDSLINDLTHRMRDKAAADVPRFIIGVSVSEAPDALMAQLGRENDSAVVVDSVMDDSPAAKAGVRKFDLILKAGGEPIGSPADLTKAVKSSDGKALALALLRSGKEMNVEITPRPNEPVKPRVSDGMIHFGPAVIDRKMMHSGDVMFGPGPMLEEIKALRKDVAELKKMVEELKASK